MSTLEINKLSRSFLTIVCIYYITYLLVCTLDKSIIFNRLNGNGGN